MPVAEQGDFLGLGLGRVSLWGFLVGLVQVGWLLRVFRSVVYCVAVRPVVR